MPLWVLHPIARVLNFIIYSIMGYRKEVVQANIRNSFPDKTATERKKIEKAFYSHFADLMVESIKNFSISKKSALERCVVVNPEVLDNLYDKGKNVIMVAGHYSNWEIATVGLNPQFKHRIGGVYAPLQNKFFDKKFSESRSKYGLLLVEKDDAGNFFNTEPKELTAMILMSDQSPTFVKENTYWTTFMNQETPMLFGAEKYAVQNDWPVVFTAVSKVKRGYYEVRLTLLEENPKRSEKYTITEKHVRALEEQIREKPEFYLWTHNRWKHKRK